MWLTQLVERNHQCFGDRLALADPARSVTWTEFRNRTIELAYGFADAGIGTGDRVAVIALDRIEVLETYFALARLGALFVPLNHSLPASEVAGVVERTGIVAMVGESDLLARHTDLGLDIAIAMDDDVFAQRGSDSVRTPLPVVPDEASAAILHTSATTGQAKGVTVDHASFRAIALGWLVSSQPSDGSVLVNCCPLYHGSMVISLTYMAGGAAVVLMPGFTPQRALAAVEKYRGTHIWLVPQMLRFVLAAKSADTTDVSSLREILYGAAPMPTDVYADATARFRCGFRQVYGMTEVGGPFVTLGPGEHPAPGEVAEVIPAGRVIPGMSVRSIDAEGVDVPTHSIGEICARGPGLMRGYWGDDAATADVTVDGWIKTGDLGFIDDDGRVHLVDRSKDLIIRAGQNVYPMEVERALRTHPAIHDAAVVGVPDPDYGEVPVAYVVADEGVAPMDVIRHAAQTLAPYKRPRRVELIAELPRNPAGKVLKKLLRT